MYVSFSLHVAVVVGACVGPVVKVVGASVVVVVVVVVAQFVVNVPLNGVDVHCPARAVFMHVFGAMALLLHQPHPALPMHWPHVPEIFEIRQGSDCGQRPP